MLRPAVNCSIRTLLPMHAKSARSVLIGLVITTAIQLTTTNTATAAVNSPIVTVASGGNGVPITVGNFENVDAIGYEVHEFFLAGNAHTYDSEKKLTKDGKWDAVHPATKTAAFKTRVVVYTPKDKAQFNGTVYVEWQNNTGLADNAPDWVHGHIEVARQGAAYVLASAQSLGIATLKSKDAWWLPLPPDSSFVTSDAERYKSLKHPGNNYSYDIYSQIAQAARDGNLLGELVPQRVIGLGESQSSFWLTTYINGVQSLAGVYDGFLLHSSFGHGMPLSGSVFGLAGSTHIRDDLVPVLMFQSETDVQLGAQNTRQAESPDGKFRLWEVAGTAHFDSYGLEFGLQDTGGGEGEVTALQYLQHPNAEANGGLMHCAKGINAGPMHWVFNAALNSINRWVKEGAPPAIAPRIETDDSIPFLTQLLSDENGNTRGGVRTPFVDVPLATLGGFGNTAAEGAPFISQFCALFGQAVPFSTEKLVQLYPANEDFVDKFRAATLQAVQAGFLLQDDAVHLIEAAENHDIFTD